MKIKTAITAVAVIGAGLGGVKLAMDPPQTPTPISQKQPPTSAPTPKAELAPMPAQIPTPIQIPTLTPLPVPTGALVLGFGFVIGIILLLLSTSEPETD